MVLPFSSDCFRTCLGTWACFVPLGEFHVGFVCFALLKKTLHFHHSSRHRPAGRWSMRGAAGGVLKTGFWGVDGVCLGLTWFYSILCCLWFDLVKQCEVV